jgi:hypothetical protein
MLLHRDVNDAAAFAAIVAWLPLRKDELSLPFRQLLKKPL